MKILNDLIIAGATLCGCSGNYNVEEVSLLFPQCAEFIANKDNLNRLAELLFDQRDHRHFIDKQSVRFSWEDDKNDVTYSISVSDNKRFDNSFTISGITDHYCAQIGYFIPGVTYHYKVVSSDNRTILKGAFKGKDEIVRYISAGSVQNVRDLGGWRTKDNKKVNYGLIYRGAALNEPSSHLDDIAKYVFNYLKMNFEIDLRQNYETYEMTDGLSNQWSLKEDKSNFYRCNANIGYMDIFADSGKANIREIFDILSNKENYPVYFHCSAGADRTGTLAFLINGLLGVPENDLFCDFELTSFAAISGGNGRVRTHLRYDANADVCSFTPYDESSNEDVTLSKTYYTLLQRYDEEHKNLQLAITNYLLECGITVEQLDTIKDIMLL